MESLIHNEKRHIAANALILQSGEAFLRYDSNIEVNYNKRGIPTVRSNPEICKTCSFVKKCTESRDYQKLIHRHIGEHYIEEADRLRHADINTSIYEKQKERLNESLRMLKKSMACDGQFFGDWKNCPQRRFLLLLP
jgi:hypothetical protein